MSSAFAAFRSDEETVGASRYDRAFCLLPVDDVGGGAVGYREKVGDGISLNGYRIWIIQEQQCSEIPAPG